MEDEGMEASNFSAFHCLDALRKTVIDLSFFFNLFYLWRILSRGKRRGQEFPKRL